MTTLLPPRQTRRDVGQALVEAAERVLARDGAPGLTVRAVAVEARVSPANVYTRFGSKDGLLNAVLDRAVADLTAALTHADVPDPTEQLLAYARTYRRFALANPQQHTAMLAAGTPAPATPGTEVVASEQAGQPVTGPGGCVDAFLTALAGAVSTAMDAGVLRPADPATTAQAIGAAVSGAVALELAGVLRLADPGASYERLLELVLARLA